MSDLAARLRLQVEVADQLAQTFVAFGQAVTRLANALPLDESSPDTSQPYVLDF